MIRHLRLRSISSKEIGGSFLVFASAFFFYLSTVSIRWAKSEVELSSTYFAFFRFFFGLLIILAFFVVKRKKLSPKRYDLLLLRAFTNVVAVFCFYKAVDLTTVAEANILNMTYPLFIAVITWFLFKNQRNWESYVAILVAFVGIVLVLFPDEIQLNWNNLWGLASGVFASVAIICVNLVRQYNDTDTILLFMFGIGASLLFIGFHDEIHWPTTAELYYLLLCALFGVCGQYLLTLGFRYVTPVEGSIISSSRILLAALLGPILVADPPLALWGWVGALLIFGTNVYLAWKKVGVALGK